jgi:hypothetical protein
VRGLVSSASIVLALAGLGGRAHAHHPVSDSAAAPAAPVTSAALEVGVGRFARVDGAGSFMLITPTLELAVSRRLALGLHTPFAWLRWADGREVSGPGDTVLSARVPVYSSARQAFTVAVGLGVELPTGDRELRLGSGHVEVNPFVLAIATHESGQTLWVLSGFGGFKTAVLDARPIDESAAPTSRSASLALAHSAHGAAFAPHADTEITARIGGLAVRAGWFAGLGTEAVQPIEHEAAMVVSVRGEAGKSLGAWRVAVTGDGDVIGTPRVDWRARMAVSYRF